MSKAWEKTYLAALNGLIISDPSNELSLKQVLELARDYADEGSEIIAKAYEMWEEIASDNEVSAREEMEGLRKYARHKEDCEKLKNRNANDPKPKAIQCTCGLDMLGIGLGL